VFLGLCRPEHPGPTSIHTSAAAPSVIMSRIFNVIPIMYSHDDIEDFLRTQTGHRGSITPSTTLQRDIGVAGDDMHDLFDAYAERFSVDMTRCLWYFHTEEEGWSIGSLFVKPPYKRVKRIPITAEMLLRFANSGQWAIPYPKHSLPRRREDLEIDRIVMILIVGWLLLVTAITFFR